MTDLRRSRTYVVAKALFWLSAGVAMAAFIGFKGIETYRIMHGGNQAPGRVIETFDDEREYEVGRRVGIVTVAQYEFFVGGERFTGTTEGPQGSWERGDNLRVKFNPRNPNENRAVGDRHVLGHYFVLVVFGGLFAYFAIRLNVATLVELWRSGWSDGAGAQ